VEEKGKKKKPQPGRGKENGSRLGQRDMGGGKNARRLERTNGGRNRGGIEEEGKAKAGKKKALVRRGVEKIRGGGSGRGEM